MELGDLTNVQKAGLLTFLAEFITPERYERFRRIVNERSRYLSVVVENVFQSHNASAVMRSCDCFGVQDLHFIQNINPVKVHPDIALGSDKWLTIHHHASADAAGECISALRDRGYAIVVTSPHLASYDPEGLPLDRPVALVFGTEMDGVSKGMMEQADLFLKIPMVGFTESLNISVSVAVCLYTLSRRIRQSELPWRLREEEKTGLLLEWVGRTLKQPESLVKEFLQRYQESL